MTSKVETVFTIKIINRTRALPAAGLLGPDGLDLVGVVD